MLELELEKTYLIKALPARLFECKFKEIIDIYIPKSHPHPNLRLRKKGDKYEMTKKSPVQEGDSSAQHEHTITLTEEEFKTLEKVEGRKVRKYRYDYEYDGVKAEIDVFQDELAGLVLADIEFKTLESKNSFGQPDFCLADVTNDSTFAGGMLSGKKYSDLERCLAKYNYQKII